MDDGELVMSGYIYDIWKEMESRSNFSTTYTESIDGAWGSKLDDGTFNGMIGMIERQEVECTVTGFSLKKSRAQVADFIKPVGFIEY